METLIEEIKNAKNYQLKSCYNRMRELYRSCSDNLTGAISRMFCVYVQYAGTKL